MQYIHDWVDDDVDDDAVEAIVVSISRVHHHCKSHFTFSTDLTG